MKPINKLALTAATAFLVATSFGSSAFADWRLRDETRGDDRGSYQTRDRDDRDDERVTVEGRISNIVRERDGYRVQLERNRNWFWVSDRRARGNDLRLGLFVRLGGVFRRGAVNVDIVEYPSSRRENRDWWADRVYVRGHIDRIDFRRHTMFVRDEFSRRTIAINVEQLDRRSRRFDLDDVRRGDYVQVWGDWRGGGVLEAARVEGGGRR